MTIPPPNILVVDDTLANLQLLVGMLKERGYKPRVASGGELALQAVRSEPPDLILLDINMPDMDGYQVCEALKSDEKLKEIPVIFLSALNETSDKVKAFRAGGADYITKPFQFEEVDARVRTHLELRRQRLELKENNDRLRELERLRDNLTHMIVHDMRTPLTVILGAIGLMLSENPPQKEGAVKTQRLAHNSALKLKEMTTQLLDISRLEAGQMPVNRTEGDLVQAARIALDFVSPAAAGRNLLLTSTGPFPAVFDAELIHRVLVNLVTNAVKFTHAGGEVKISVTREASAVRVAVADDGAGIPPEHHGKIFDKFSQVEGENKKLGAGLGLTFCKLAVEAHGGRIGVESEVGKGSTFWFTLPSEK